METTTPIPPPQAQPPHTGGDTVNTTGPQPPVELPAAPTQIVQGLPPLQLPSPAAPPVEPAATTTGPPPLIVNTVDQFPVGGPTNPPPGLSVAVPTALPLENVVPAAPTSIPVDTGAPSDVPPWDATEDEDEYPEELSLRAQEVEEPTTQTAEDAAAQLVRVCSRVCDLIVSVEQKLEVQDKKITVALGLMVASGVGKAAAVESALDPRLLVAQDLTARESQLTAEFADFHATHGVSAWGVVAEASLTQKGTKADTQDKETVVETKPAEPAGVKAPPKKVTKGRKPKVDPATLTPAERARRKKRSESAKEMHRQRREKKAAAEAAAEAAKNAPA